jgi:pyruvate/2-oxoglutarate dehydrogenase complex dihydrolipoamide dehydrogenase (E3) component
MAGIMNDTFSMPKWESFDEELFLHRVRPSDWINPTPSEIYDLVVIGAGPAGLVAAEAAIALGRSVALIERNRIGGNSLNVGSIPSKSIIQAGRLCAAVRVAAEFCTTNTAALQIDYGAVLARMHRIRARIAEYHSAERLRAQGVDLFFGNARFTALNIIEIGGVPLRFKKAIIATGARPAAVNIAGLDKIEYRTSATIFEMAQLPRRLAVIGGGPLGCEMAQAFCRLGSHVSIIEENPKFLPRDERDAAELLSRSMARDGVEIRLNTKVRAVRLENDVKILDTVNAGIRDKVDCDEILLSVGRIPNIDMLDLEVADISAEVERGISVDASLRTTNPDVYAAGDVCMDLKFSNAAEASARVAVHNALTSANETLDSMTIPWCTYCEPEIAHIGMHVWEARENAIPVKTFTVMMQDVDRAITDGQDLGFVKIHTKEGADTILGATIVSSRASEMINELSVIMSAGVGMGRESIEDRLNETHHPAVSAGRPAGG